MDIVQAIFKEYEEPAIQFRDCYGMGNMTIGIEAFKDMASVVLDKLQIIKESEDK